MRCKADTHCASQSSARHAGTGGSTRQEPNAVSRRCGCGDGILRGAGQSPEGLRGVMPAWPFCLWKLQSEDADIGELLDALNTLDAGGAAAEEPKSTVDQAAKAFQSASRRVGDAVDSARQPDMPLDVLAKLVRQVPLQSLAIAFVLGVMVARR